MCFYIHFAIPNLDKSVNVLQIITLLYEYGVLCTFFPFKF